jgi:hypothetical protein
MNKTAAQILITVIPIAVSIMAKNTLKGILKQGR